jgi:hypothetical protein
MSEIKCYLNDTESHPQNLKELEVQLSFENDSPAASVKTTSFDFWGEDAEALNKHLDDGLLAGVGIFEGLPFRIEKCGQTLLDGSVNLSGDGVQFECDKITSNIVEKLKIDFLRDTADGFSFAYLADTSYSGPGKITSADYLEIPYVISAIPDYTQAMMMGVSVFIVAKETADVINKASEDVQDLVLAAAAAIATAGVSVAWEIAKLVALVGYLVAMALALFKLIQLLVDNIIQKKKTKLGMRCNLHFQRACEYLGYTFSSTILQTPVYDKLTIIPQKIIIPGEKTKDETKSNPKYKGHFDGTFADFIQAMEMVFNAKVRIIDQTLHFERVDFFNKQADYILPNINVAHAPYYLNSSELSSNLFIKYQLDSTDLNTFDEYSGTSVQVTTEPKIVNDKKLVFLKSLNYKNIPFALAKRKTKLTSVEQTLQTLLDSSINLLIDAINLIPGVAIPTITGFENRIGWMKLSTDFIGIQKIALVGDDGYISPNNVTQTSALALYNNFHSASTPINNQYYIYKDKEIPLCCEDFVKIKNNNVIKTYLGEFARVDSLTWNPHNETAKITYRVKRDYTKNLQTKIVVNGN